MFPLSLKYKRKLKFRVTSNETDIILNYLEDKLKELNLAEVERNCNEINFNKKNFNGTTNWHILAPINGGNIILKNDPDEIIFEFSTKRLALITSSIVCFFLLLSQSWFNVFFVVIWNEYNYQYDKA